MPNHLHLLISFPSVQGYWYIIATVNVLCIQIIKGLRTDGRIQILDQLSMSGGKP